MYLLFLVFLLTIERWNMLSEQYFKSTTWPSVDNIESMIPNESMKSIFLILYKEMYFRHIYASIQVKTKYNIPNRIFDLKSNYLREGQV